MFKIILLLSILFSNSFCKIENIKFKDMPIEVIPNEIVSIEKDISLIYDLIEKDFKDMLEDRSNYILNIMLENTINFNKKENEIKVKHIINNTKLIVNFNIYKEEINTEFKIENGKNYIIIYFPISINNLDENWLSPTIYNISFYEFDQILKKKLNFDFDKFIKN